MKMNAPIYVALDFPSAEETLQFLNKNELHGVPVKIGMELFYREGPRIIDILIEKGHRIFLDLKLHDIPTTVNRAMQNIAKMGVDMVTVHASGGSEMIKRAKEGLLEGGANNTKLLAVTILTSMNQEMLNNELSIEGNLETQVTNLSSLAKNSGADGVVSSVHEVEKIKQICGSDFLTVTPGIRMENSGADDQKRVATPHFAKHSGADILVIGRSITRAEKPREAYKNAIKEIEINGN